MLVIDRILYLLPSGVVRGKTAQDANPVNRGDSLQPSVGSVSGFLEAAELRNGDSESSWLFVSYF